MSSLTKVQSGATGRRLHNSCYGGVCGGVRAAAGIAPDGIHGPRGLLSTRWRLIWPDPPRDNGYDRVDRLANSCQLKVGRARKQRASSNGGPNQTAPNRAKLNCGTMGCGTSTPAGASPQPVVADADRVVERKDTEAMPLYTEGDQTADGARRAPTSCVVLSVCFPHHRQLRWQTCFLI